MAEATLTTKKRQEIELLITKIFDSVDKTGTNTQYYQTMFAKMTNDQFYKFISRRLPFRFHTNAFKVEPTMDQVFNAFKILKKPLLETIYLPYQYTDKDGNAVKSKECLVGYANIKRMKQMRIKKTNTSIEIGNVDMKTGRLIGKDKAGLESNKEFEGVAALGLDYTMAEYARVKADGMRAKTEAYNMINVNGEVSYDDISIEKTDSIAKNTFNVYLIGCHLHSNLIDTDYFTPHTLAARKARGIGRK